MCGLQLMAVSCWFYCTKKYKAINSRIEQKYKEPDERSTKPNQTNRWCAISMHVWEKNPLKLVHLWKNPPYPFCWLRICTLLKNKYDHNKKNTTLSFGFISKIKIVRPKKKWNEYRTLHTNRTRNCFDIRLSGWLSGKTTS